MAEGWLKSVAGEGGTMLLQAGGHWDARNVTRLDLQLRDLTPTDDMPVVLDLGAVERLDTAGA